MKCPSREKGEVNCAFTKASAIKEGERQHVVERIFCGSSSHVRRTLTSLVAFKMEDGYRLEWRLSLKAGNDKEKASPREPLKMNKVLLTLDFSPVRFLTHSTVRYY